MSRQRRPGSKVLGDYLVLLRLAKKLTLRQVEEATEGNVSNGYLSQIEKAVVKQPSPNILYHLAEVYGSSYELLMTKAGHKVPQGSGRAANRTGLSLRDLSPEEERELLRYLRFIRERKKDGK